MYDPPASVSLIACLVITAVSLPYARPAVCYAAHAAQSSGSAIHDAHGHTHADQSGSGLRATSDVHECSGLMLCATAFGAPPTNGEMTPAVRAPELQDQWAARRYVTPPMRIPDPPPPRA